MGDYLYLNIRGRVGNLVYQRTAQGCGNVPGDKTRRLQIHAYVPHNTSHSQAQLACREKFRASMLTWHTLSENQKKDFSRAAARGGWSGLNLFMSIKMRS